MTFNSVTELAARFAELGATNILCKRLAENDNSKQQIYLGASFEVLSLFPYGEVAAYSSSSRRSNFKAPIDLYWVGRSEIERAEKAQLIFYPRYPEVRLSGFLSGCRTAPSEHLRPFSKEQRNGGSRGVLVFGTTPDRRVLCFFAVPRSPLGNELYDLIDMSDDGIFCQIPMQGKSSRSALLEKLREVNSLGAVCSTRMTSEGECISYLASNAGGTTLEALLGIRPNSASKPDYLGWEIKAFSERIITLMTPEPNGGNYSALGVRDFTKKYGHQRNDGSFYFTGLHRYGVRCKKTGLTLDVSGFDVGMKKIFDVDGKILLRNDSGEDVASWSFGGLLTHWSRKHASAAYIPVKKPHNLTTMYRYQLPVILGEGTDFGLYLSAVCSGAVVFDPGSKVEALDASGKAKVKARSQFRIGVSDLDRMYLKVTKES